MKKFLLALAFFLSAPPVVAQEENVTLEKLLSASFPDSLVAAPSGGKVAWVENAQGTRNIWVAGGVDRQARKITNYKRDDGQELTGLTWSPDAKTLVYVRGGDGNRRGEIPNPTSAPGGAEQAIWRVSVEGGEPTKVALGTEPTISPCGDAIAFVQRGQIFSAPVSGGQEPSQLVHARGALASLRWSPDGSKLAFVSVRGAYSFIGILDIAAKDVRFLEPSVDRDIEPTWSPDGLRVAFLRLPSQEEILFAPVRSSLPWSIVVADAGTGKGKVIWRAEEGVGSAFHEIVAANQIFWGADDRLIFPWERDGWTHLYTVSAHGGSAVALTPGAFEVETVSLTPDRRELIYSSNQDDMNRRHLWRVGVAGGRPTPLTPGKGIEWSPAVTSDGTDIAFFRSDARRPAHAVILIDGREVRQLAPDAIPSEFPEKALVEPESVIFSASDGMRIHGQLFLPPNFKKGERRPAIVFAHGGSRRQMLLGWHYMGYYHNAYALNQYLAHRGYIVLSINYRSGIGYGMQFREALNYGASGASEFHDVMGAGLYLRSRADVDQKRIGLWGGSYGGYLTALGLARASDLFTAGVDIHGVHDWNVAIRTFLPNYNPLEHPKEAKLAFDSSPMASIDTWRSPTLIIHGDDDRNVSFSESMDIVKALRKRNVAVETLILPDEVHDFLVHRNWLRVYHATSDFFDRTLQNTPSAN